MKNLVIKITAWTILIVCNLLGLSIIALIFILPFIFEGARLFKLISLDIAIFIFGFFVCILGFGAFEFFNNFIHLEEEIEEIKKDVDKNSNE